jgi:hypothetical protein
MATDPVSPEVLVSVPDEMEAAAIVGALSQHGIRAHTVGGYTSGFRAEAPGMVKVMVGHGDLDRARELLAEIHAEPGKVDWSNVDVGDRTPLSDEEKAEAERQEKSEAAEPQPWRFQFRLATLLIVQTAVSVALAVGRTLHAVGLLGSVGLFIAVYLLLVAAMVLLMTAGTVVVASDLTRARAIWRYVGRALIVGLVTLAPLVALLRMLEGLGVRL